MASSPVVVPVESGLGAADPGCADGPARLRAAGTLAHLPGMDEADAWSEPIRPSGTGADRVEMVAALAGRLAERVREIRGRGRFPLVVGGDHSIAIGTWSGVRASLPADGRLGLLWIDAHLDSHTFATTPSRNIHGMPLACLLGRGDPRLTGIGGGAPKVRPEDVCIVGARSFETGELELLQELGVRIYFMPEVRRRGAAEVISEALRQVARDTAGYGISLDVDAFDPAEEAGSGTPVPGGLRKREVLAGLSACRGDSRLLALEIVEFNPRRDRRGATARAIRDICAALL